MLMIQTRAGAWGEGAPRRVDVDRFTLALLLVAAMLASTTPALGQQDLEQPSAPGGLGNTRSDLDLVYGAVERTDVTDFGDYASDAVSYEDEWVFYLIEDGIAPSPEDRAFIIHRYAEAFDSFRLRGGD